MRSTMTGTLFFCSVLAAPAHSTTGKVDRLVLREKSVFGLFESMDATGCIITDVTVTASNDLQSQTDGLVVQSQQIALFVGQFDICRGLPVLFADGLAVPTSFTVDNGLHSATLTATVPMVDETLTCPFNATVNLSFTGRGSMTSNSDVTIDRAAPALSVRSQFHGDMRDASGFGTIALSGHPVLANVANAISSGSYLSMIQNLRNSTTTVSAR